MKTNLCTQTKDVIYKENMPGSVILMNMHPDIFKEIEVLVLVNASRWVVIFCRNVLHPPSA
jgi:hypothetical protein